jgi:hypothetical protein
MADMNKKEMAYAAGGGHSHDAFFGRLSGANLSKFADMVAERVLWTLGTIDNGSRNLMGRTHPEPNQIGFQELRSLPPAPVSASSYDYDHSGEDPSCQPVDALEHDSPPPRDEEPVTITNVYVGNGSLAYREKSSGEPEDDDWGVAHRDLSEDNMIKEWKEHTRTFEKGKKVRKRKRGSKLGFGSGDNREAEVYDSSGKLLNIDKPGKKERKSNLKKDTPSLVARAMAADKKIIEKQKDDDISDDISEVKTEEKKVRRAKPDQSFDRL